MREVRQIDLWTPVGRPIRADVHTDDCAIGLETSLGLNLLCPTVLGPSMVAMSVRVVPRRFFVRQLHLSVGSY